MSSDLKWVTLFDKQREAEKNKDMADIPDIDEILAKDGGGSAKDKRLSVERIYQKKTQLEHILLRPDTYIGSVEKDSQTMWVYDDIQESMVQREITYVPGLYKIFDEILVNAADNKQRDPKGMNCMKIDIDPENNKIRIWNNGKGIPVIHHKTEKMYVPTLIFGHLLTSSNYNDEEQKVTGGRNGYGAKLCNIFSSKFTVETQSNEYKKAFKQSWTNNMSKATEPKITASKGDDYTCITFYPDLKKFKMDALDKDIVDLFMRRAYDLTATCHGVKIFLNGKKLAIKNFKDYIDLYIKNRTDDTGSPLKLVHEIVNDRWEVGVTLSEKGFQQVSFVNSIATTKGGRHVDYVADQIVSKIIEVVKKKEKKGIQIKPFQVRSHIWVFVNCLVVNPTFDSQTKENMTLQFKSFGSKCTMSEKFITNATKSGIVESILSWMKYKAQEKMNKKCHSSKHSKLKGIPKLDDANDAGTKNSGLCTLILTEGDSAKTLAVAGLAVIGRDHYGVFPLRGKMLNVREASHKQIMENAEINNVIKILGLQYKHKYDTPESMKSLRYGKLMIMTDQDQDGSHIKGLLINFVHHNWPGLLRQKFVEEFITPIVKVSKKKEEKCFYSLPEFEEWKADTNNWHTWKVKYYKGLGTSTSKEAKEYFSDMDRHRIPFRYGGTEDDASIVLAFSRKKIEERKEWLTNWMEERKRRADLGLPELFLYGKATEHISYTDFVNRELILYSNMDNVRSIPCAVDGFKPGQRKVIFTCFKRNLVKELKVAQLAGSVAELSAYHHGEMSLMGTIINLAQNFVGSNNINLLDPIGQFGTRLHGGKDSASPRYIFTQLNQLARKIFHPDDDPILKNNFDDNQKIEPEWYMPIIPMVLINGADGIGTGWSTKIQNYDPREVVNNLRKMLDGEEPTPMVPFYKGFSGQIEELDSTRCVVSGEVSILDDDTIEISELPLRVWTQNYKENVLEPMLTGTDKIPAVIQDFKEYHTDVSVRFVVKMTPQKLAEAERTGLHKFFKLQSTMSTACMVLFDHKGCIHRYENVLEILKEFYKLRLDFYQKRKNYLQGLLSAESLKLDNQARFICEKIDGIVVIENKPKKELIQMLVRQGYDSDPIKTWKETQEKMAEIDAGGDVDSESEVETSGPDFNYLLNMPMWFLTKEKKEEMLKNRDAKAEELYQLKKKTPSDLWRIDLNSFLEVLDEVQEQERLDALDVKIAPVKTAKGRAKAKRISLEMTKPSIMGRRVDPVIDSAILAKTSANAARKKKAQTKKEALFASGNAMMIDDDDDSVGPQSLADRIGGSPDVPLKTKAARKAPPVPRKPRAPKEPKEPKEPKKRNTSGSPKKKGGKKRNPWSDDSDEEDPFGSDMSDDNSIVNIPRETTSRRTAASKAKKYTYSDEENEEENFDDAPLTIESDGSDDWKPKAKPGEIVSAFKDSDDERPPIPKTVISLKNNTASPVKDYSDEDDDSDVSLPPALPKLNSKPPAKPKATPSKPIYKDDSDESDDGYPPPLPKLNSTPPAKKKAAPKPAAAKKPAAKSRGKKAAKDASQPSIFSAMSKSKTTSHSDEEIFALDDSPVKTKKSQNSALPTIVSDSDSDDGLSVASSVSAPAFKPKKAPAKKSTAKRKAISGSDDEKAPKPRKPAAKPKAKKKKIELSSDEEMDFSPVKKGSKKASHSDSDDEFVVSSRATTGRSRKAVKYNFGDDDDEGDDDFL